MRAPEHMGKRLKWHRDVRRLQRVCPAGAASAMLAFAMLLLAACSATDDGAVTGDPSTQGPMTALPGGGSSAGGDAGNGAGGAPSLGGIGGGPGVDPGGPGGQAGIPSGQSGNPGGQVAPPGLGGCGAVSQTAENVLQPVDIIFGIDTSGSMATAVAEVQRNLNAFSQQISAAGIDVRVIMLATLLGLPPVTTDGPCVAPPLGSGQCPNDSNPPGYIRIEQEVTSWDVLDVYVRAYPSYKPHLRENSLKTFVSISDDDASAETNPIGWVAGGVLGLAPEIDSAEEFINAVAKLEPGSQMWADWRYSGIFVISDCPTLGGAKAIVHPDLVQRTGGVAGDLCLQDFAPVFDELAKKVTNSVAVSCDWGIPAPPVGETFDAKRTNVQIALDGKVEQLGKAPDAATCASRDGWYYNDESKPTKVVACPATCNRIQSAAKAQVDVQFGCETIPVLF